MRTKSRTLIAQGNMVLILTNVYIAVQFQKLGDKFYSNILHNLLWRQFVWFAAWIIVLE